MSDTSLVFNLVARDRTGNTLQGVRDKFDSAAAGIGVGVAGALGVGVAQAMDMSAANAKLAAQLGLGPAEAAQVSKVSADVYSNAWGDSTETVNEAIRGVYNNIGDVSQAKGGLEGVTSKALALAETFDMEVGPTTAAVGQLIRTGLADNADEAFDILTTGFQSSANKADDFLEVINEYSTQFRRVGLDGQTATGLIAQGMEAGARDADQVADAIGQFGERALAGGTAVDTAFASIGLNAGDMASKIGQGGKSAEDALQLTMEALRGTGDEQTKLNAAAALFGDPGNVLGEALFALDPASAAASSGMDKASGSTDKLMKTMGDSPAATLESFKRKVTVGLAEVAGTFLSFASDHKDVMVPLAVTLGGIAAAVLTIKAGMMVWTAAQAAWSAATAIATGVQWLWNAALAASPMTWIIIGIVALVAAIVIIATKTTWFQTIWSTVWGAITTAFDATVSGLSDAFSWFGTLPGKFAGWFGAAKDWAIQKMLALVSWQFSLPGRLWNALSGMAGTLYNVGNDAFQSMKTAAVNKAVSLVTWTTGLPGRLVGALNSQGYRFYNIGLDFVKGIWNGISAMGGWLWANVANFASDNIVNPVLDFLHIGSPSKLAADEIGHWFPAGIAMGIEDNADVVDQAARGLLDPAAYRPTAQATSTLAPIAGANSGGAQLREFRLVMQLVGGSRAFREFFQESVRVSAGGDVVKFAEG